MWFARNYIDYKESKNYLFEIKKNEDGFGWIYLLKTEYYNNVNESGICIGKNTQWCDLRYHHSDLSLRPHFQHGIFISKSNYSKCNYDLNEDIVATIKFPLSLRNNIEDINPQHIFPSKAYDNTYKYLSQPRINKIVHDIEKEFGLDEREVGRIFTIKK